MKAKKRFTDFIHSMAIIGVFILCIAAFYNPVSIVRVYNIPQINISLRDFHRYLATQHQKKEEYLKAINHWKKVLEILEVENYDKNPDLVVATHYNAGSCYYQLGRYNEAIEEYRKVLAIDPTDSDAQKSIELSLERLRTRTI